MRIIVKFKIHLFLSSILIFFSGPLAWGFEISSFLKTRVEYFTKDNQNGGNYKDWGTLLLLDTKIEKELCEKINISLNPLFQTGNLGYTHGILKDWGNEDRHKSCATLKEGYLELKIAHRLYMGGGIKTFLWGVCEGLNPTNFTPKDWVDVINSDDIGVPSAWIHTGLPGGFYAEGLVFNFVPSKLPLEVKNRWRIGALNGWDVKNPDTNNKEQFAARIGGSWLWGDLSFVYFEGESNYPEMKIIFPFIMKPEYFSLKKFGFNIITDFFGFTFTGEAAYNKQGKNQDDYILWGTGIDRNWSFTDKSFYVLIEYIREHVVTHGHDPGQKYDLRRIFKNTLTGKIDLSIDSWIFEVKGAVNLYDNDFYIQPRVSFVLNDEYEFSLGYDHLAGSSESFFGIYKENKRFFGEIKSYF